MFHDVDIWRLLFDAILVVALLVQSVYVWIANRTKANRTAIEAVEEQVVELGKRFDSLSVHLDHMPNENHIRRLHDRLNVVDRTLAESIGRQDAIIRQLEIINEHLLQASKA